MSTLLEIEAGAAISAPKGASLFVDSTGFVDSDRSFSTLQPARPEGGPASSKS